jgi:hypothetical protein
VRGHASGWQASRYFAAFRWQSRFIRTNIAQIRGQKPNRPLSVVLLILFAAVRRSAEFNDYVEQTVSRKLEFRRRRYVGIHNYGAQNRFPILSVE